MTKIIFFGASVSQQHINRDGEETGYVPNLKKLFKTHFNDEIEVIQKGFGSGHFNQSGFVYFDLIMNMEPDVVVFEWFSTSSKKFDEAKFAHVQKTLLDNGIKVINLVLPKKDCLENEPYNIKQARGYQELGCHFINLYPFVGNKLDLDLCLRDNVHTTAHGGKLYAEIIFEEIKNIFKGQHSVCDGPAINPLQIFSVPSVQTLAFSEVITYRDKLIINISNNDINSNECQIFAKVKVGKYSPIISYTLNGITGRISVWDAWSHYERSCLKPISNKFNLIDNGTITFEISETDPDYSSCKRPFDGVDLEQRKLPIIDDLFIIGGQIDSIKFVNG
jgi:hypothetical protein